ncbi:TraM recognition domain-containing protein [Micromonospora sp. NBC_00858]|uniref:TraM recognition domain-containing protein n=1 Tax=Micromonospora sp. NBC_00858 TaxID=2975979 RepID=UPI00386621C4|nr:TraM recognition domain-containing protein [Micromonospora sp. NBC_00858]
MRGGSGNDAGATVVVLVACGATACGAVFLGGTFGTALAGGGWRPPPVTMSSVRRMVEAGPTVLWPETAAWAVYGGIALLVLIVAGLAALVVAPLRARLGRANGLATPRDLAAFSREAVVQRARGLRPSLEGVRKPTPDQTGNLLGDLHPSGPELRSSFEDVELDLMAPRAGKSTGIAVPRVLRAQGSVLITSNKSDVFAVTRAQREKVGTVWTFDPQGVTHTNRAMWWDMLAACVTVEGSRRLAGHFVASVNDDTAKKDFWISAAQNTLTSLFLAAARNGVPVTDMLGWLADPGDRAPIDLLRDVGLHAMAEQLQGTIRGAVQTRDGIYETARQCVSCLLDPAIAAWVTPDPQVPEFRPDQHVLTQDTLYLLSKDGGGSAAGVIAGLADTTLRAGVMAAEGMGGRLDPPMTAVLDEAANVCRISDLPDLYSHLGSRGINIVTLLQSYKQGARVWGEAGMDALWGAATIKLLGAGLDDADFVDKVARLVGQHDVKTLSVSRGRDGTSRSTSYRQEQILPADKIRALPKGTALLFATGVRPALIRLRPWYKEPNAGPISAAAKQEERAIAERAAAANAGATPAATGRAGTGLWPPLT